MKKKLSCVLLFVVLMLGCFYFQPSPVHADIFGVKDKAEELLEEEMEKQGEEKQREKKEVKQGGVILRNSEFPLTHYEGLADTGGITTPWKSTVIGAANAIFWFAKLLYEGIDKGISLLSNQTILEENLEEVETIVQELWEAEKDVFLPLLFGLLGLMLVWYFFVKGNFMQGITMIGSFVLVFLVAQFFVMNAAPAIRTVNGLNTEFQTAVLSVGAVVTDDFDEIDEDQTLEGITAVIRNTYFDKVIYRCYLLMNYGTANAKAITKEDSKRIDDLLSYNRTKWASPFLDEAVKAEVDKEQNEYMDSGNLGVYPKLGMAIGSLILTIGIGVPLLILGLFQFFMQLFVLLLMILLAVSFLISLIPYFRNSYVRPLLKVAGALLSQAFLVIFILIVVLVMAIIDRFISPTTSGGFVLNSLLVVGCLWLLLKKRDEVVSLVTAGRVQMKQRSNPIRNTVKQAAKFLGYRQMMKKMDHLRGKDPREKERSPRRFRFKRNNTKKQKPSSYRGMPGSEKQKQRSAPKTYSSDRRKPQSPRSASRADNTGAGRGRKGRRPTTPSRLRDLKKNDAQHRPRTTGRRKAATNNGSAQRRQKRPTGRPSRNGSEKRKQV